ncbi:MAG: hypothetical protein ACJAUL_003792 [Paraglaciecola sp.]|jgi:hypothetical protein
MPLPGGIIEISNIPLLEGQLNYLGITVFLSDIEEFTGHVATVEATLTDAEKYLEKYARRAKIKRDKEMPLLFKYG